MYILLDKRTHVPGNHTIILSRITLLRITNKYHYLFQLWQVDKPGLIDHIKQ